jgi:hypothetical protein
MAEFAPCETEIWERQKGLCGLCGESLRGRNWDGHHIDGNWKHDWPENGVFLCVEPSGDCHQFAHDYDTKRGALLNLWEFPFYNGEGLFGGPPLPDY